MSDASIAEFHCDELETFGYISVLNCVYILKEYNLRDHDLLTALMIDLLNTHRQAQTYLTVKRPKNDT